ncbi:MAG: YoaK family protein [Lachnospiraceae bacterium]
MFLVSKQKSSQMSESIILGVILALSGGCMDAYSYLCRGHVFANAQTGNMLLLGINLFEQNWAKALAYALPVLAFTIGIVFAETIRYSFGSANKRRLHWRHGVIVIEILCLIAVSFMPQSINLLANSLTSMACGMQVEAFRKIHGNSIATTMCIGNLRSGTESLCAWFRLREKGMLRRAFLYYGVIVCFVVGAVVGNSLIKLSGEKAILICPVLLAVAFMLMLCKEGTFTVGSR